MTDIARKLFNGALEAESKGDFGKALLLLKRALLAQGDDREGRVEILSHLGDLYLYLDDAENALPYLKELVILEPENHNVRYLLGFAYSKLFELEKAEKEFRRALSLKPDEPEYLRSLGWTLCLKGRVREGERILRSAFDKEPYNSAILTDLAMCLAKAGKMEEALKFISEAREIDPDSHMVQETYEFLHDYSKLDEKMREEAESTIRSLSDKEMRVLALFGEKMRDEPLADLVIEECYRVWIGLLDRKRPRIRRPEAWAAAVEYTVRVYILGSSLTKTELAKKYRVSVESLSRNYIQIVEEMEKESNR
jgi:Tfp pilus assembly protein PilF